MTKEYLPKFNNNPELEAAVESAYQAWKRHTQPPQTKCCCGYEGDMVIDQDRGGWWSCPSCGMI